MIARHRTAEEWIAELDSVLDDYRNGPPGSASSTSRRQTIGRLVELGFSTGEAVHYLDGHSAKPAVWHVQKSARR